MFNKLSYYLLFIIYYLLFIQYFINELKFNLLMNYKKMIFYFLKFYKISYIIIHYLINFKIK